MCCRYSPREEEEKRKQKRGKKRNQKEREKRSFVFNDNTGGAIHTFACQRKL